MADGDTQVVKGGTRISIDKAAGTSTVSLIAGVASKRIVIREATLVIGAASKVELVEETSGDSLFGPLDGAGLGAAFTLSITDDDAPIETITAGKAVQISRSVSATITGSIVYTTTD